MFCNVPWKPGTEKKPDSFVCHWGSGGTDWLSPMNQQFSLQDTLPPHTTETLYRWKNSVFQSFF